MPVEVPEKLLLSAAETAQILGMSRSSFYSLLSSGRIGPLAIRLSRSLRWDRREIERWVAGKCVCRDEWLRLQEGER